MLNRKLLEEWKHYKGTTPIPEDFDAFWDELLEGWESPQDVLFEKKDFGMENIACYELTFSSTNHAKIYAKIVLPVSSSKVPVIFSFHGYMGRSVDWTDMFRYPLAGFGFVTMDVRGQSGYSTTGDQFYRGNTVKGQLIRGAVDGPQNLFYKDVFLDVYTLIELVADMEEVDEHRLASYGFSQGGALSIVAAALNPRIQQVVAIAPFLADFGKVLEIGNTSEAYDELFRYFKFHDPFHETEEAILRTLAYVDIKNLAHRIKVPLRLITNLEDTVCYPITQFAVFNNLQGEKEHYFLPEYAHEDMHVYVNDLTFNWLCGTNIANESLLTFFKD